MEDTSKEIHEFGTLNTLNSTSGNESDFKENDNDLKDNESKIDLDKPTTKGLRITEGTKRRYNEHEKNSNMTQDAFVNFTLDILEKYTNDPSMKYPELKELEKICKRIPEIFLNTLSKMDIELMTVETNYSKTVEELTESNGKYSEDLLKIQEELEYQKNESKKELENLTIKYTLELKEKDEELEKLRNELSKATEGLNDCNKELKESQGKIHNYMIEQGKILELSKEKDDKIAKLSEEVVTLKEETLKLKEEKNELTLNIEKLNTEKENFNFKMELYQEQSAQQKIMYENQIEQLNKMLNK